MWIFTLFKVVGFCMVMYILPSLDGQQGKHTGLEYQMLDLKTVSTSG